MSLPRVTHKHVEQACQRYNKARGLTYSSRGYLQWANMRGDGSNRRGLYVTVNDNGGVATSGWRGRTIRETIANIDLAIQFWNAPAYQVIINAIHERGKRQIVALDILSARGLWLSAEQREQAGLEIDV